MADLFDIAVARKLSGGSGGGGGGTTVEALSVTQNGTYTAPTGKAYSPVTVNVSGGSSDFSTATVTVVGDVSNNSLPCLLIDPEYGLEGSYGETNGLSSPFTVILYKGKAYADLPQGVTSGNIEFDDDLGMYIITGDCTITIS